MKKHDIPNALTLARIAIIPLCLALWYGQVPALYGWLLLLFVLASLTDFLDGYLARRWQVISPLGTMLDPMADKLLVATLLILLTHDQLAPVLLTAIIIGREIFISGLRECLAMRAIPLPVSQGGKWKTATQMGALSLLLLAEWLENPFLNAGAIALLCVAALLALTSAYHYTRAAIASFK